ncbi:EscU/YscU/HrcU family type III secretion system export apparatus switch protein [Caldisalinibacter kiritimatiensis]|uniref:Flagellar biosynthetic protein flhB n=1 Tax=Caldisalinibacter kiritimatiensis TaxID=1304284 RepID=R1AQC0_9FIRM|nr:EscU/YscU/HrcU family type III secretion system export apparatus switch protein [Caldisalinibacter kiritimatiensis]EOC99322.1 Flagellar biosynthetic protein flhB [Caldisalinibacter kiritimatiensis]
MNKDNKEKIAVALKYDSSDKAPIVIAKGKNNIADKIIEKAEEEDIHIHKEKELAENLYKLDLSMQIPEEYYAAVAEILAFIYTLDKKQGEKVG